MISTQTLGRMRVAAAGVAVSAAAGLGLVTVSNEASAVNAPTVPEPTPPATTPAPEPPVNPAFDPDDCPGCGLG